MVNELQYVNNSVESVIDLFVSQYESIHTKINYKKDITDFLMFLKQSGMNFEKTNPILVFQFANKYSAPATKNRKISTIKSFFRWMQVNGFIKENSLHQIKLRQPTTLKPTEALSDEEVKKIFNLPLKDSNEELMAHLLFKLALRRSELISIKCCNFRKERGTLILEILGKGNKLRQIPITDVLEEKINKHISDKSLESKDYLIGNEFTRHKKQINPTNVYRFIKKCGILIGTEANITPHSCRATTISHLLDNQVPIRDVADFVGHSSTITTQIYDKKRDKLKNSAAMKVNY